MSGENGKSTPGAELETLPADAETGNPQGAGGGRSGSSVKRTRRREPGTPITHALDIDVAKHQLATSVTRRRFLSQDQWVALLDWLDYLQAEFPKRSAEEWKALLKGMPR